MCIFQSVKFGLYPDRTDLHLGYQMPGESSKQWVERARLTQRMQNKENHDHNRRGLFQPCYIVRSANILGICNERKAEYQPAGRYQLAINPTPSPEPGDEHRKYWVVDTSPSPYFVAPGIIIRGFDGREEAERDTKILSNTRDLSISLRSQIFFALFSPLACCVCYTSLDEVCQTRDSCARRRRSLNALWRRAVSVS